MRLDESRPLNPGLLRHRITWQSRTEGAQDAYGAPAVTWTDVATCPCQVKSLSGRELESARQRWAEAQYIIRQWYVSGLHRVDRGVWYVDDETRYLDVLSIEDRDGVGRVQTIIARDWVD